MMGKVCSSIFVEPVYPFSIYPFSIYVTGDSDFVGGLSQVALSSFQYSQMTDRSTRVGYHTLRTFKLDYPKRELLILKYSTC